jgi:CRISPR-associated protein (TIGR02584 family)
LLSGDPGWFRRLREDYNLPEIAFGLDHIRVIAAPGGKPLVDILDEADNTVVADFITEQVREITADANVSLHVSIAGGRKTMGFYVGYALSLFGRAQDRLSHVLVSPPFESLKEFFYPAPHTRLIHDRDGHSLDAKDARVHLGDIPFVRLRDGLPERLLAGTARFSEAVAEAQKALPPIALHLDPQTRTVTAGGESFVPDRPEFALYWLMAKRCIEMRGGVHWSEQGLGEELLALHRRLVSVYSGSYEQTETAYKKKYGADNFDPSKTHLNRALKRALGERRAAPYLITRLTPIPGTRYHQFGLSLPPEAVMIASGGSR